MSGRPSIAGLALFGAACGVGLLAGETAVVAIAVLAGASMGLGALSGRRALHRPAGMAWAEAVAGGAMLGAAGAFLLPAAARVDVGLALIGGLAGLVLGGVLHGLCGRALSRHSVWSEPRLASLSLHAAGAGIAVGLAYARPAAVGPGLAAMIVAHKWPAGFVLATALRSAGHGLSAVLWPAGAVGVAAVPTAVLASGLSGEPYLVAVSRGLAVGLFVCAGLDSIRAGVRRAAPSRRAGITGGAVAAIGAVVLAGVLVALGASR